MAEEDERLFGFLADLEQQAASAFARERDLEVVDRARAEYARVTLVSRLMASTGRALSVQVTGVGQLSGELLRVGPGWLLMATPAGTWLVPLTAVAGVRGLDERSTPEEAWPVTARLGLVSALRSLAGQGQVQVRLVTGDTATAQILRVGADFVEARTGEPGEGGEEDRTVVWPFTALAALRQD